MRRAFQYYRLSAGGGLRQQVPWLVRKLYGLLTMPSTTKKTTDTTMQAVKKALSSARMGTYETAAGSADTAEALELYAWNAQVSAALLAPLHVCEVVIRNAVAEAIEVQYGANWPWSTGFERSLPDPKFGYSPRKDLQSARRSATTVGKVIPELKFVFWQKMFTRPLRPASMGHSLAAGAPEPGPGEVGERAPPPDLQRARADPYPAEPDRPP